ncbi:PEP-CTERM sorting domain-containing protein [Candidatus Poribacteria bacterium]|nr:PEP-CTERM sorting domain-containing protein [Candidatus Poribacteria bacterium]
MRTKNLRWFSMLLPVLLGLLVTTLANGTIIFSHTEATDPETEGWTKVNPLNLSPPNASVGPVINDLGLGINAWFDDDNSQVGDIAYRQIPTAQQIVEGNAFGWVLRANLRAVSNSSPLDGAAITLLYRYGTTISWQLNFGPDADGDPMVSVADDVGAVATFTLEGAGSSYNLYELRYNPITSSADLFVNGVERISDYTGYNYTGFPPVNAAVFWGSGDSLNLGRGHWNLAEFEITSPPPIPEPSTLLLFSIAIFGIIGYRCLQCKRLGVSKANRQKPTL